MSMRNLQLAQFLKTTQCYCSETVGLVAVTTAIVLKEVRNYQTAKFLFSLTSVEVAATA